MTDWTEIEQARAKAHAKHGENSIEGMAADDPRWLSVLAEEGGEASEAALLAWNALLQARLGRVAHEQTYDATGDLRGELVDVLAVASAWLDALDGHRSAPSEVEVRYTVNRSISSRARVVIHGDEAIGFDLHVPDLPVKLFRVGDGWSTISPDAP